MPLIGGPVAEGSKGLLSMPNLVDSVISRLRIHEVTVAHLCVFECEKCSVRPTIYSSFAERELPLGVT